jgi:hypothetical protein
MKSNNIVTWGQHEDVESPEGRDVGVKHLPMCLQTKQQLLQKLMKAVIEKIGVKLKERIEY